MNDVFTEISDINQLLDDIGITKFKFISSSTLKLNDTFTIEFLEDLCYEIASHTPDAMGDNALDEDNENRRNPYVGALLIDHDEVGKINCIYGCCRSAISYGDHGEYTMLTQLFNQINVNGLTMFVSLEPCTHESRKSTKSCSEIIRDRQIKTIFVGTLDPNPDVCGFGIRELLNNGIDVHFFSKETRKKLLSLNKDFNEQFKGGCDPRLNKKINRVIGNYLDKTLACNFLLTLRADGNLVKNYLKEEDEDILFEFYTWMIENKSIISGGKLLEFDAINDFALAFYKSPYNSVDCADIRYSNNSVLSVLANKDNENYYRGPLLSAFDNKYSSVKHNFLEELCRAYNLPVENDDFEKSAKEFLNEHVTNESGFNIVKEAFLNSIIHRDYQSNYSFTEVEFYNFQIVIKNPLPVKFYAENKLELEDVLNKLRKFDFYSLPVNPKLMRYFQILNMCERSNNGMATFKNSAVGLVDFELEDVCTLKTTIRLK